MKRYIVYTSAAEYHVTANNRDEAKNIVHKITFGRVSPDDMTVHVQG